jgi:hypothetical protein
MKSIQIMTDREMYDKANELGQRELVVQTTKQIQRLADVYPGESRFVINKSISNENAFVVVMVTTSGLFGHAAMLLDWGTNKLDAPASSTIEEIAQYLAKRMIKMLRVTLEN